MDHHERAHAVRSLLFEYVRSPSLQHLRDPHSIDSLAKRIIQTIDREPSVWRKWEGERESLLRSSSDCWIPVEDLRQFLNGLPGPQLTATDVAQRVRSIQSDPYSSYPDERLRERCLELYNREIQAGTEIPAVIGALQEFVEQEGDRLRGEAEAAYRERQKAEREALELRFLSGADCKWTPVARSKALFIRKNGRAYRLSPKKEKRWDLFRIEKVDDPGRRVGTYGSRGDASKALAKLAYESEARW